MMWHLVTGEYPPACGGVGDYSARLAQELAGAGDTVNVWAPGGEPDADARTDVRCRIHRLPDRFGSKSRAMVERYAHVAPETLQHTANRLDATAAAFWLQRKKTG